MDPGVTGAITCTLELEQLAVAEVTQLDDLHRIGNAVGFIDAFGDAVDHGAALIKRCTVAAAGGHRFFHGGVEDIGLVLPELLVGSVRIHRAVAVVVDGPVTVLGVFVHVLRGFRAFASNFSDLGVGHHLSMGLAVVFHD